MTFLDLLRISLDSLRRRKLRTFLTVLGVVIGTTSVVAMMSLGIGMKSVMMEQIKTMGSLTTINVIQDDVGANDKNASDKFLKDKTVTQLSGLEHVKNAYPVLSTNVLMLQGKYQGNVNLTGIPAWAMEQVPLGEGSRPVEGDKVMRLLVGNMVAESFYDPKATGMSTSNVPVDFHKPMFTIFETEQYFQAMNGGSSEDGTRILPPKKYILPVAGYIEGDKDTWNQYSYETYVDIDILKKTLKKIYRKNPIPGQPTTKKGKAYPYFTYSAIRVIVDDVDNVESVQRSIKELGYQANSDMEWIKATQDQMNMVQAVFGGIGAVSLLVAAIGIANTMMMSIYERTKEIGVMKVLGCDMDDIRNMFLIEAGFIGFFGGIVGLIFSFGVSAVINRAGGGAALTGMEVSISQIPFWLAIGAIGFATLIGMGAGFFPAKRAMQLSPLAAIRNE